MTIQEVPPSNPPAWLRWFVNDAIRGVMHRSDSAPIGCHFYFDSENTVWEVTLFVSRSEVLGGAWDGKPVPTGLEVDILKVSAAFDRQPAVFWQAERVLARGRTGITPFLRRHEPRQSGLAQSPADATFVGRCRPIVARLHGRIRKPLVDQSQ
ncbi:MAG UNVERIFIED_CONTAM: hypothetical protein LVR18_19025 [Planctomycetaceae bacterium]|jgi:hypothetical protein